MRREGTMIKKIYDKPQLKVVNLELVSLICKSSPSLTKIPVSPDEVMEEDEDFE